MPIGAGKYDKLATWVRERAKARGGVILIVIGGEKGDGFSAQLAGVSSSDVLLRAAAALRGVANNIERDAWNMRKD
jgi:hypothetical protein